MCALEPAQIVVIILLCGVQAQPWHCHYLISRAISAIDSLKRMTLKSYLIRGLESDL